MTATATTATTGSRSGRWGGVGLPLALLSASTFGTSGSFATALTDAGWTPGAAVTARVGIAAIVLALPAVLQLRRMWPSLQARGRRDLLRSARLVGLYGVVAVALCQLCFFLAVQRLSVGVALLLEYLGIVLVVLWQWIQHGDRPKPLTVGGSATALLGLVLVLDLTGHQRLDPIGVLWGLGAAVGLATFYLISARTDEPLPPLAMAWAAMTVGALLLVAAALLGVLPVHATFGPVQIAGRTTSWLVPLLGLSLIAAVVSYVAGIGAARRLGARLASFVGLTEVLFAVLFAWLLLGQLPGGMQLAGGVLIVAGVALVRVDELRTPAAAPVAVETTMGA
jgi:drug/metabolite transporter (DMT)-like permease